MPATQAYALFDTPSANGGVTTKLRLLLIEQAQFNGPGLFDDPIDTQLL